MEPRIQYAKTEDGVNIAYTILGAGVPLVFTTNIWGDANWYSHDGSTRRTIDAIVDLGCQVIRYDGRGMGSSDRDITDFSLPTRLLDLEAVLDRAGLNEFALCGYAHGGPTAAAYAAEHGNRVTHLVLVNTYAVGSDYYDQIPQMRFVTSLATIAEEQWDFFTMTLATAAAEFKDLDLANKTARLFRSGMMPDGFLAFMKASSQIDLNDVLPGIATPTLVVEDRSGFVPTPGIQRALASAIPGAEFSVVESYVSAIGEYLELPNRERPVPETSAPISSSVRTVLFTDIVGHTEMMSRLGDKAGRDVLREHERITREALSEHGGDEVKTMGDGFMASFGSVTKAVECAIALQRGFAERESDEPLSVRVGLNAGEPIEEDGDLFGATVILASRIAAKADGGEILVADTVRGLCSGKGFSFADRGEFVAKGFEEPVRVYEVSWRE